MTQDSGGVIVTNRAPHRHAARACIFVALDVSFTIIYKVMFSKGHWGYTVSLRSCFFSFWLFARCFTFYM